MSKSLLFICVGLITSYAVIEIHGAERPQKQIIAVYDEHQKLIEIIEQSVSPVKWSVMSRVVLTGNPSYLATRDLLNRKINDGMFDEASSLIKKEWPELQSYDPAYTIRKVSSGDIQEGTPFSSQENWNRWGKAHSKSINAAAYRHFALDVVEKEFARISPAERAKRHLAAYQQIRSLKDDVE